jgi:hypothetical protein
MMDDHGRGVTSMSGTDFGGLLPGPRPRSVEELAREQGVRPVQSLQDMRADLLDTDEELDEFLAEVRASRQADLG